MKRANFYTIVAIVIGLCASSGVMAQNSSKTTPVSEKYLISAKAGGVNYLEGTVTIVRATGKSGVLLRRDQVEIGDRVTTGADGRAEILLNPGSYIRLGKNSSFEFGTTDLEDLQIRLDSGSAMFEVFAADEFRVSVFTPKGKVALIETGVYRIDVLTDGTAMMAVSKGKAEVGEANPTKVKGGRTATVGTDTVAVAKFDKDKRDDLGEWSRTRSKELTKLNSSLRDKDLGRTLFNGFSSGSLGLYNSFGLWIYSAQFGGHCFLPFGYGWRSPYGWWYDRGYNPSYIPSYIPPVNPPRTTKGGESVVVLGSGGVNTSSPMGKGRERSADVEPPPFTRVSRGSDPGIFGNGYPTREFGDFDKGGVRNSSPSSSPGVFSPGVSAPAPASSPVSVPIMSSPKGRGKEDN